MNIVQAIMSKKPFRRGCWKWPSEAWLQADKDGCHKHYRDEKIWHAFDLKSEDLAAEDWEVFDPWVTVTQSQFWKAATECFQLRSHPLAGCDSKCSDVPMAVKCLAIKLGIEA